MPIPQVLGNRTADVSTGKALHQAVESKLVPTRAAELIENDHAVRNERNTCSNKSDRWHI